MNARHSRSLQRDRPRSASHQNPARKAHPARKKRVLRRWQELFESRPIGK